VVVVTGTDKDAPATSTPIIRKPFDSAELVDRVQEALNGRAHARVPVADHDNDLRQVLREALHVPAREVERVVEADRAAHRLATAARSSGKTNI
jgi:FixJ family two-component response regulator